MGVSPRDSVRGLLFPLTVTFRGAWLTQMVERVTLALGVVCSSPRSWDGGGSGGWRGLEFLKKIKSPNSTF